MLLVIDGSPRGIRCDITGKEMFDKFTYYSLEGKMVTVDTDARIISKDPQVTIDLDYSEEAYEALYKQVKDNVGKIKPGYIKCDLSNEYMAGKFKYWAILVTQVLVDIDSKDPVTTNSGIFDMNVGEREVLLLIEKRNENRSKKFVPKGVARREVLKITAESVDANAKKT